MISIACAVRGLGSSEIKALPNEQSLGSHSGHVPRGEPRGLTGHPIIFNAFINHLEGDAPWLLPKPADDTTQTEWWLMKRWGQRCGEIRVTGLMQTERVCSGSQSPATRSQECSRPVRRENPLSWKAEQGVGKGCWGQSRQAAQPEFPVWYCS